MTDDHTHDDSRGDDYASDDGTADDSTLVEERVDALLEEMTVAEKAGQCCGTFVGTVNEEHNSLEDVMDLIEEYHLGFASPFGIAGSPFTDPAKAAEAANRLQRHTLEETRLGIPIMIPVDAVHGHAYVNGATTFPHNLGLASTWDPDLVARTAQVTARELRVTGAHQNYGPTCDVAREPRWGRTFETFGESPHLCAELTAAKVSGYRRRTADDDARVYTTAKHFPAYGQPERGEDASPVDVSPDTLRRTFLPPFAAAIEAGVDAVMPCYNAVNNMPAHGSERYLTNLLRDELGFQGFVVSDWGGVEMLHRDHCITESLEDSVRRSTRSGLDVLSIGGDDHAQALHDAVDDGALPEQRLDRSARRVLMAKFRLGLFDDPFVDPAAASQTFEREDHRNVAYEAARKSVTLLKNESVLPFDPDLDEVLVTGPNADDPVNQVGGWSVTDPDSVAGTTVREGVEAVTADGTTVTYEPGTGLVDPVDVEGAAAAAAEADAAMVVLGEGWYIHEFATSVDLHPTEFPNRTTLDLPDAQRRLLRAVYETGTPTALVLVAGRPLSIRWAAEHLPAIVAAFYPGSEGGRAVADVLFGECEPGGRLPISVPRSTGHLSTRFDYLPHPRPIGDEGHPSSYDPLFAFGHGLSYTEFAYTDLSLSTDHISIDGTVEAAVTVENTGDRDGEEVVQVYLRDDVSSRVTPVRTLCGFERVRLAPGEEDVVHVRIDHDDLAIVHDDGHRAVEPGTCTVFSGGHSATFSVTGG